MSRRVIAFVVGSILLLLAALVHLNLILPLRDSQATIVFGTYWASGRAATHGLNPYALYPETSRTSVLGPNIYDWNLNPPIMLPYFAMWSRLSLQAGIIAWTGLSLLIAYGITGVTVYRYRHIQVRQVLWLLTSFAMLDTIVIGQSYVLLLLLSSVAWWLIESGEDLWAGVLLGVLVAIKPNVGVWPLLLILAGRRRILLPCVLTVTGLSFLPVLLYGPAIYREWIAAFPGDQHYRFLTDASIIAFMTRLGSKSVGVGLSIVLLIAVAILAKWRRPGVRDVSGMALCTSVLCAPIGWVHYVLMLAPVLLSERWDKKQTTGALLLWIPLILFFPSGNAVGKWITSLAFVLGFVFFLWSFVGPSVASRDWLLSKTSDSEMVV